MLHIGERITQLRKQHHLSQEELAKRAQVSRTIIGNYERNTNTPSIEVLVKLARVFNVTVDYLIGEGQLSSLDKDTIKRIEDIENLSEENKNFVLKMIDMAIQNFKTKQAFG
jgi:transcriptional regulator with XRE-family HTH domain